MSDLAIVPDEVGAEGYVSLGGTSEGHARFRKHFLTLNAPFVHPRTGETLRLGEDFWQQLKNNFDTKRATNIVQVPVVGADNKHTEDPMANIGSVVELERDGDKLYAVLDVPDEAAAGKLGKTLLGCSAFFSLNATDPKTGEKAGAAMYHLAVTNRPHLVDLEPFEAYAPVVAASAALHPFGMVIGDVVQLCAPEVLLADNGTVQDYVYDYTSDDYPGPGDYPPDYGEPAMPSYDIVADEIARYAGAAERESRHSGGQGSVSQLAGTRSSLTFGTGTRPEYAEVASSIPGRGDVGLTQVLSVEATPSSKAVRRCTCDRIQLLGFGSWPR